VYVISTYVCVIDSKVLYFPVGCKLSLQFIYKTNIFIQCYCNQIKNPFSENIVNKSTVITIEDLVIKLIFWIT